MTLFVQLDDNHNILAWSTLIDFTEVVANASKFDYSPPDGFPTGFTVEGQALKQDGVIVSQSSSRSENSSCSVTGEFAHAEGQETLASGVASHAEGGQSTASGQHSHAEGSSTNARWAVSHAEGAGSGYVQTLRAPMAGSASLGGSDGDMLTLISSGGAGGYTDPLTPANLVVTWTAHVFVTDNSVPAMVTKSWVLSGAFSTVTDHARMIGTVTKTVLAADAGAAAWDVTVTLETDDSVNYYLAITPMGHPTGSVINGYLEQYETATGL